MSYVGQRVSVPENTMCSIHPEIEATHRFVVSVDGAAVEHVDYCEDCGVLHQIKLDTVNEEENIGNCEWCRKIDVPVFETRDPEEGMFGAVYDVCRCCIREMNEAFTKDIDDIEERMEENIEHERMQNEEPFYEEDREIDEQVEDDDIRYANKD